MKMRESEMRRLLRVPLQAFGQEAPPDPPTGAFVPSQAVLKAKPIAAARLRVFFSPAHDIAEFLHAALGHVPQKDRRSWPEQPDWRDRALRRMLRTWTPQSHVEVAVHPANLRFLPPDEEIVVSGWAPTAERENAMSLAMLGAPLTPDTAAKALMALVTHLALAELRGAARSLHQKRLSRKALDAPDGPQPAAARRLFRGPHLRPALHRVVPSRRNLHFATA